MIDIIWGFLEHHRATRDAEGIPEPDSETRQPITTNIYEAFV